MGSSTVVVEDEPFTYMLLPVLSCQDIGMPSPPRKKGPGAKTLLLPLSIALSIPAGPPVFVGGPPTISLMGLGMKLAMGGLLKGLKKLRRVQKGSRRMEALSDRIHRKAASVMDKLGMSQRARDRVHKAICTLTGHPVDVVTGRVVTEATDWELPGPIPLRFTRHYSSSLGWRDTAMGYGWSHSLDLAVWEEDGRVVYRAEDGRELEFDTTGFPRKRMPVGAQLHEPTDRLTLLRVGELRWEVEAADGLTHVLRLLPGERQAGVCRVVRTRNRAGHSVEYEYDGQGRLRWVKDSAGRRVLFENDTAGRLIRVALPHPREPTQVTHNRYVYSEVGHLIEARDALDQAMRYAYEGALLVRETDRTGLSFHFEYDGQGPDAWCVRTWGDGGIYDHRLRYDKTGGITEVTNSLGHTTTYHSNGQGVVSRKVDPYSQEWLYTHDQSLRLTAEVDPLGNTSHYEHDARGNRSRITSPTNAVVCLDYNSFNQPVRAIDSMGGAWYWSYDSTGNLTEMTNPVKEVTRLGWVDGMLAWIERPGGRRTTIKHDSQGNVSHIQDPTGATTRYAYDRLGRLELISEGFEAETHFEYDLAGRLRRVRSKSGGLQERTYDAEANLLEVRDATRHVRFSYGNLHKIVAREEMGGRLGFSYDPEGQLIAVENEAGESCSFSFDSCGRLISETGFDGRTRHYERDRAGRVSRSLLPSGRSSSFQYDEAGRITRIAHSDGSGVEFLLRADGLVVGANSDGVAILLERDAAGRVVRETREDLWVASHYGADGERERVETSLGARALIGRDPLGNVSSLRMGPTAEGPGAFAITIQRDPFGRESMRRMPGGVLVQWERDRSGRPSKRNVTVPGSTHLNQDSLTFLWRGESQLSAIIDAVRGTTHYEHDTRGRLVTQHHPSKGRIHRMLDAIGNIHHTPDGSDRRYARGGILKEADGVRYVHDEDGNLIERHEQDGLTWRYRWSGNGLLREVERPDGHCVRFEYDAFARRTRKSLVHISRDGGESLLSDCHFVWDGHFVIHELSSVQGMTTWYWEPEVFSPLAKERGGQHWSIVSDPFGTPSEMYDEQGRLVWRMHIDIGATAHIDTGEPMDCPWRWPGQYEDEETGLLFNRHRYFDPKLGAYISQDPLRWSGGLHLYAYVEDVLWQQDPLGLHTVRAWLVRGNEKSDIIHPETGRPYWKNNDGSGRNGMSASGFGRKGDSENLLMDHLKNQKLQKGDVLVIESLGEGKKLPPIPPCDLCGDGLDKFAKKYEIEIIYMYKDKIEKYPKRVCG
ncbi:DUF6531 domain-containing protein [Cystobacter fuscus]|uniref:DUF6531 domain-containing protein n=1 Tax=Cystobacter fuscus TaxID=43 RepID=UPI0037C0D0C7